MTSVCVYFKVHQPYRLKKYEPKDVDILHCYEDAEADSQAINYAADHCYLPANALLLKKITEHKGNFKVSFSISGTMIELLEKYRPDVIRSFRKLFATGCVEILGETYYHSLSSLHSKKEFQRQVQRHSAMIREVFGSGPVVFRNTELIHNNELAKFIAGLGFKGLLCEGSARILQGRTPNKVYASPENGEFGILLRNTALSDDIAFRFDDPAWSEHPLTAEKFASWIHAHPEKTEVINLFMDYETIGIHKTADSGIFDFIDTLPLLVLNNDHFCFSTPSAVLDLYYPKDIFNSPQTISWEDKSDNNCVWNSNTMQNNAVKKIYSIESMVISNSCPDMIDIWGRLQAADHFYYMQEQKEEGNKYSNPFASAEMAFQHYTNILIDFEISSIKKNLHRSKKSFVQSLPAFNLY